MTVNRCWPLAFALLLSGLPAQAQNQDDGDSQFNSAVADTEVMPRSPESLILDLVRTDSGLVAVGERGHVLKSSDGRDWQQVADVPTRSTLTTVYARGNRLWAAGHDSVILHSADGGATWTRQNVAADVWDPQQNNPLLDIFFLDDQRGFALGAYATLLETSDGGQTWQRREMTVADEAEGDDTDALMAGDDDESYDDEAYDDEAYGDDDGNFDDFEDVIDYHLNAMTMLEDGTLYIAAERGNGYVSRNGGQSWVPVLLPYGGSMFGVLATADQTLVTFGMRGNVFESTDGGQNWNAVDTGSLSSLMGGIEDASGRLILVGANGEVLVREADGRVRSQLHAGGGDLAAIALVDGGWIVAGEDGVGPYTQAASAAEDQP